MLGQETRALGPGFDGDDALDLQPCARHWAEGFSWMFSHAVISTVLWVLLSHHSLNDKAEVQRAWGTESRSWPGGGDSHWGLTPEPARPLATRPPPAEWLTISGLLLFPRRREALNKWPWSVSLAVSLSESFGPSLAAQETRVLFFPGLQPALLSKSL